MPSSHPPPVLAAEMDRLFATLREETISVTTKLADAVQHRIAAAATEAESTPSRLGERVVVVTLNLLVELLTPSGSKADGGPEDES